jgi:hypothetical protein
MTSPNNSMQRTALMLDVRPPSPVELSSMGNLVNLEGDPEFAKKLEIAGNAAQQMLEFFEEHRLYFNPRRDGAEDRFAAALRPCANHSGSAAARSLLQRDQILCLR